MDKFTTDKLDVQVVSTAPVGVGDLNVRLRDDLYLIIRVIERESTSWSPTRVIAEMVVPAGPQTLEDCRAWGKREWEEYFGEWYGDVDPDEIGEVYPTVADAAFLAMAYWRHDV